MIAAARLRLTRTRNSDSDPPGPRRHDGPRSGPACTDPRPPSGLTPRMSGSWRAVGVASHDSKFSGYGPGRDASAQPGAFSMSARISPGFLLGLTCFLVFSACGSLAEVKILCQVAKLSTATGGMRSYLTLRGGFEDEGGEDDGDRGGGDYRG